MSVSLDPKGNLVTVGNVLLRTSGLTGQAELLHPSQVAGKTRASNAVEGTSNEFEEALEYENVTLQETLAMAARQEFKESEGARTRGSELDESAIEVQVPDPPGDMGQFVLTVNESGLATWSFSPPEAGAPTARGARRRKYLIPRYMAPSPPETEIRKRGWIPAAVMKLIKVLIFPLVDELLGEIGERFAARWEEKKRPYALRTITPANYNQAGGDPIDTLGWEMLGKGRALLLVHGTFSRAHTAFGGLSPTTVAELCRRYEDRVFAFDHYTMSEDPAQNVRWLVEQIPDGSQLDFDILCHSRGGLVSRVLAERQSEFSLGSRHIAVNRIVFVAAPNAGTILTDSQYLGDFLDTYTNLLNFFPTTGVTEVLEGVVTVAKMLAVGAVGGLPGLQSMLPGGSFLRGFDTASRGGSSYYALTSDYEPTDTGLKDWAVNRLTDKIFQKAANDLVVPTLGVYEANGSACFPISNPHVFPPERGISHSGYFADSEAQKLILGWLS